MSVIWNLRLEPLQVQNGISSHISHVLDVPMPMEVNLKFLTSTDLGPRVLGPYPGNVSVSVISQGWSRHGLSLDPTSTGS